ncbi:MAG: NAD(P)-dependent alcohol dehydrogenase [Thermoanaerobaculia bacterium]
MKAFVFKRYGSPDVLELEDVAMPVPGDGEVLIRVHAVSINDWDWDALCGTTVVNRLIFGLRNPKKQILGSDVAGRVESAGPNVRNFRPGDEVFGDLSGRWGGFAEYVCAPEKDLALKAPGMSFEQAAAIPQAAMLAVQALRDIALMRRGQTLLINGAGGGVGTFAIQLARLHGLEITAVDRAEKLDMLRSMGAAHVIDYAREDFTRNGRRYDLILDVKTSRSLLDCARALNPDGTYVTVGGSMPRLVQALLWWPWIAATTRKKIRLVTLEKNKDLHLMNQLFEDQKVVPVIDRCYDLEALPEAFHRFAAGLHQGKIVITCSKESSRSHSQCVSFSA